jgi:NADPH2:quinone reductase
MRVAWLAGYGTPESIEVVDVPDPVAGPGQVVVEVAAAAVNFPDVLIMADRYQISVPAPFTPGSEFAGVVTSVGAGVSRRVPGDRVFGTVMVGAFAEQICVRAEDLSLVPDGVSLQAAAAFGVVYRCAYHALRSVAEVRPGDWVVVLGAAGGIGLAAVDIAVALGARVVAAASSADKLEVCRSRGAEGLVVYTTEDLKERVKQLTSGGADVVIDPVGGPYAEQALRACRWGARFVCVGFASGEIPRIPLNLVLLKGVTVLGFEFRSFSEHAPELAARDRAEAEDLLVRGVLRPHVSAVLPLEQTGAAVQLVADRGAVGKVLIEPAKPAAG